MLSGILSILTSKPKGMPCHFSPAIPFLSKSSSAPFTISLATLNIQPAPLPKQRIPSKYLQAASPKKAHLLSSCNRKPFSHTLLAASTNGLTQLPLYTTLQLPSSTVFSFFCWKKSPHVKLPLAIKTTNLIPYQPVLEWHVVIPDGDTCHNRAVEMSPQNGGLHFHI